MISISSARVANGTEYTSWGYGACPDLHEQRKVLPLLQAEQRIGLRLTESDMLDPEHSTVAIVVHHPQATYFSVR